MKDVSLNYCYLLKLAKIFKKDEEFDLLKALYFAYKKGVLKEELFTKKMDDYKKEIVQMSTNNLEMQYIMGELFDGIEDKQDIVNIISYLSIIEYSVNKEEYEKANECKSAITKMKGVTEQKYFKMYKYFVTDCPVDYDL